ncbi:MAG: metalloregulator ArsR/SmtB family transcription factor [Haloferacaceae archaeon]
MSAGSSEFRVPETEMADLKAIASESDVAGALDIFKALADDRRILIMRLLDESDLCVCDLVEVFDIEYSKLSYHLKKLKDADLVATDRTGNYVTYRPTERGEEVIEIIRRIC